MAVEILSLLKKSRELLDDQWTSFADLNEWFQSEKDLPVGVGEEWERIYQLQDFFRNQYFEQILEHCEEIGESQDESRVTAFLREFLEYLKDRPLSGKTLLEKVTQFVEAERGIFLSSSDDTFHVRVLEAVNLDEPNLTLEEFSFSRTILIKVLNERRSVCLNRSREDDELGQQTSIAGAGITSVLAVPITHGHRTIGILYLDSFRTGHSFSSGDQACIQCVLPLFRRMFLVEGLQSVAESQLFLTQEKALRGIIGKDAEFLSVLSLVRRVAVTPASVLLSGESGTGKELIAHAIHALSDRRKRPFVPVNCAAIPETLLESELFGHEKGAFTGADRLRIGKVEQADGGTLFLDEIGELKNDLQAKLLRFLQSHEIERLGGGLRKVDVRIVSATNQKLEEKVESGQFREDLYYRLNVFPITLPPLRNRLNDIPVLAQHFFEKYAEVLGLERLEVGSEVYSLLQEHDYPGNVRELENLVYRILLLSPDGTVGLESFPSEFKGSRKEELTQHLYSQLLKGVPGDYEELKKRRHQVNQLCRRELSLLERRFAEHFVAKAEGNISEAARLAGIDRRQLYRLLSED